MAVGRLCGSWKIAAVINTVGGKESKGREAEEEYCVEVEKGSPVNKTLH